MSLKKEKQKNKNLLNKLLSNIIKYKIVYLVVLFLLIIFICSICILNSKNKKTFNTKNDNMCEVKFESAGGTPIESLKFKCGNSIEQPSIIPEKEGFVFKGWTYLNEIFDFNNPVNENIVLLANYQVLDESKVIIVSFDSVGGSLVRPIEVLKGNKISAPLKPTKNGYEFAGWYLNDKKFDFNNAISNNIILKAKWEKDLSSNSTQQNNSNIISTSSEYKCSASYSKNIDEKTVTTDYNDHVNWTFSTGASYTSNECYITYKSSDSSVATVSDDGTISAKKKGTTYIYACFNDNATKDELGCFKGKLIVTASQFENEKELALNFANAVSGYYWYLDGDEYAYLHPTITDWYDHTLLNWDSEFISLTNNKFVTSSSTGVAYYNDSNIHNYFLANPTELGYSTFNTYNMRVSGSKLYITVGGKQYSFTKSSSKKSKFVSLSLSSSTMSVDKGSSQKITLNINQPFINHNITISSSNSNIVYCSGNSTTSSGKIDINCNGYTPGNAIVIIKDTISGKMVSFNVIVNNVIIPVTGISLNRTNLNLFVKQTENLSVVVSPSNADNKKVIWSTSDPLVAKVNNGKVTAVGKGTAIITAKSEDGNYTTSCSVDVSSSQLLGKGSIGISTISTSSGIVRGLDVRITPSGGSGSYNYYYIKLYKNGTLIGETTNTLSNSLFMTGYLNGSYSATFEIRDTDGNMYHGSIETTTISGF